jgi:hypothetical protein
MFSVAIVLVLISAFRRATNLQNRPGIEKNCFEAIQTDGMLKTKIKLLSLQINFFLCLMTRYSNPSTTTSGDPWERGEPIRYSHAAVAANGSPWSPLVVLILEC